MESTEMQERVNAEFGEFLTSPRYFTLDINAVTAAHLAATLVKALNQLPLELIVFLKVREFFGNLVQEFDEGSAIRTALDEAWKNLPFTPVTNPPGQ